MLTTPNAGLRYFSTLNKLTQPTGDLFFKIKKMHDIVIGLLINKVEFGRDIHV
ncbi:hypothetical protein [Methyloprofundus sedimenti]|uniref:hypothetical protein n=1 Tax=Methyloprofundus sedimenti TaxID=1420851 RepID=UPI001301B258|nr:hypothetical protein [Methyloprofundus sedimenti]